MVAAGGVADGRGLAAALMLGAEGCPQGTRFYASQEAPADAAAKAPDRRGRRRRHPAQHRLRHHAAERLAVALTGRVLRNAHPRWFGREAELMRSIAAEAQRYAEARAAGDFDIAAVIAGEAVGLVRDIPPAAEIVDRVVREAEALLAGHGSRGQA